MFKRECNKMCETEKITRFLNLFLIRKTADILLMCSIKGGQTLQSSSNIHTEFRTKVL